MLRHSPTPPTSPCNAAEDHKMSSYTRITSVQEMRSAVLQFLLGTFTVFKDGTTGVTNRH